MKRLKLSSTLLLLLISCKKEPVNVASASSSTDDNTNCCMYIKYNSKGGQVVGWTDDGCGTVTQAKHFLKPTGDTGIDDMKYIVGSCDSCLKLMRLLPR